MEPMYVCNAGHACIVFLFKICIGRASCGSVLIIFSLTVWARRTTVPLFHVPIFATIKCCDQSSNLAPYKYCFQPGDSEDKEHDAFVLFKMCHFSKKRKGYTPNVKLAIVSQLSCGAVLVSYFKLFPGHEHCLLLACYSLLGLYLAHYI